MSEIKICNEYHNDKCSEDLKQLTFTHELTHSILSAIFDDKNNDEKFVESFSQLMHQAIKQIIEAQK